MPVLVDAKIMAYVTNHNMITIEMGFFKPYKMADKGETGKKNVLAKILVYTRFFTHFICRLVTKSWKTHQGQGVKNSCAIIIRLSCALCKKKAVRTAFVGSQYYDNRPTR